MGSLPEAGSGDGGAVLEYPVVLVGRALSLEVEGIIVGSPSGTGRLKPGGLLATGASVGTTFQLGS